LSSLGNKLDMTEFKAPLILKDLLLSFSIKDGKIEVSPFEIPIGASTLNLAGYSKLDYSINFDGLLSVPKSLYENNHAGLDSYIPVQQLSRLDSVQWSDLQFGVIVVGTYGKPSVKIDYRSTKKRVVDNVKNQVKSRIDDERYLLKKQAETELDEAKKRAEAAKKVAEDKAKAAIEEQKKRVEEQIQKEKEAANKKVQDELKKKRDELLKNKFPIPPK
jgi:molecular chaperone DnaK (HSP70)